VPPPFSAKKIQGVPAYKLARKKKEVSLEPVKVEIKQFELIELDGARVHFRARVASGTYVRSIAHELGQMAGCGAHLESLRRTSVAEFTLSDAHRLQELEQVSPDQAFPEEIFVHPRKLLPSLPSVTATDEVAGRIRHGQSVNLPDVSRSPHVKVFQGQRDLIAIASRVAGPLFHPKIVFG
jgi:tRNA pseudouridine55 synthase